MDANLEFIILLHLGQHRRDCQEFLRTRSTFKAGGGCGWGERGGGGWGDVARSDHLPRLSECCKIRVSSEEWLHDASRSLVERFIVAIAPTAE